MVFECNRMDSIEVGLRYTNNYDMNLERNSFNDIVTSCTKTYFRNGEYTDAVAKLSYISTLALYCDNKLYGDDNLVEFIFSSGFYKSSDFKDYLNLGKLERAIREVPDIDPFNELTVICTSYNFTIQNHVFENYHNIEEFLNAFDCTLDEYIFNPYIKLVVEHN